jgi:hypothetical protein
MGRSGGIGGEVMQLAVSIAKIYVNFDVRFTRSTLVATGIEANGHSMHIIFVPTSYRMSRSLTHLPIMRIGSS